MRGAAKDRRAWDRNATLTPTGVELQKRWDRVVRRFLKREMTGVDSRDLELLMIRSISFETTMARLRRKGV